MLNKIKQFIVSSFSIFVNSIIGLIRFYHGVLDQAPVLTLALTAILLFSIGAAMYLFGLIGALPLFAGKSLIAAEFSVLFLLTGIVMIAAFLVAAVMSLFAAVYSVAEDKEWFGLKRPGSHTTEINNKLTENSNNTNQEFNINFQLGDGKYSQNYTKSFTNTNNQTTHNLYQNNGYGNNYYN